MEFDKFGPSPDVDVLLSILLQSNIPSRPTGKMTNSAQQSSAGPAPSTSDLSSSNRSWQNLGSSTAKPTREGRLGKRKEGKRTTKLQLFKADLYLEMSSGFDKFRKLEA